MSTASPLDKALLPPRWQEAGWEKLSGDASTRRYFRLSLPGGETALAALYDQEDLASMTRWIEATHHLSRGKFPVPKIVHVNRERGFVLHEDFGDSLLEDFIREKGTEAARPFYERAVDMLCDIQTRGTQTLRRNSFAAQNELDEVLFTHELEHTREWLFEKQWNVKPAPAEKRKLEEEFAEISRRAAGQPVVLCHRDWHARNLMLRHGDGAAGPELGIIDHQDMRLGPYSYDLASLLYDSYAEMPVPMREDMAERFLGNLEGLVPEDRDFVRDLRCAALQRNLKALGTFAFQALARKKENYLEYQPRTLGYVREHLAAHSGQYPALEALMESRQG
jgi:hypothetical protein